MSLLDKEILEEFSVHHPDFWHEKIDRKADTQVGLFDPDYRYGGVPFKFIDLFGGIGGFRSGLERLGGECVYTSEWDENSAKTYKKWYDTTEVDSRDFRKVVGVRKRDAEALKEIWSGKELVALATALGGKPKSWWNKTKIVDLILEIATEKTEETFPSFEDILCAEDIPDHDILCAGFPCQPFSLAGVSKKNSLGRSHGFEDDKQGNLFFSILDTVYAKKPPVLFLENVKNLKSHDEGRTWKKIKESLEEAGYHVFHKIIDAQGWVPQHRERIFIVCFNSEIWNERESIPFLWPDPPSTRKSLADILEDKPDKKYMLTDNLWKYLQEYKEKHADAGHGFGYGIIEPEDRVTKVARTISARYYKDGAEILIREKGWRNPRRLTPREACLLQGFDDEIAEHFGHDSEFPLEGSDTQAYKQFGNAVVPAVVAAIGKNIQSVIIENEISLSQSQEKSD